MNDQCKDCIYHRYDKGTGFHSCLEDVEDEELCDKWYSIEDAKAECREAMYEEKHGLIWKERII